MALSEVKRYRNVSFSGCGFLGVYHIGVASCLKTYAPYLLENNVCGSSAGAITACGLLCDVPLELMTRRTLDIVTEARSKTLGPFSPSLNISEHLYTSLDKDLPDDVHKRVSGKLFVSLTRVPDGKNVVISEFTSKENVLQVLCASAFIPVFSGFKPPLIGKHRYIDGGFTDNLPILDKNTITISPFSGLTDICPRDNHILKNLVNISNNSIELTKSNCFRVARIMFPPKPQVLAQLCNEGFDDALYFLQKNNLINCKPCLLQHDPSCLDCKWNSACAIVQGMPYSITYTLDRFIESHGALSGILKSKAWKLIKLFTVPYIVIADLAYVFIMKFICCSIDFQKSMWTLSKYVINSLLHFVDIFSEKGLECVSKVLSHSSMSIENQGKYSPYYDYYNERLKEVKSIKFSKNSLEYLNEYRQITSTVVIDSIGYTSAALNLNTCQVKSVESRILSTVCISINQDPILSTSNQSNTNEITKVGTAEELDKLKFDLLPIDESFDKFTVGEYNHEGNMKNLNNANNTEV